MTSLANLAVATGPLPVASLLVRVHEALDEPVEVPDATPGAYAALVADHARARARLRALELKLIAAADRAGVAQATGLATTGAWVAQQTRADQGTAARQASLARDPRGMRKAARRALEPDTAVVDAHEEACCRTTSREPSRARV